MARRYERYERSEPLVARPPSRYRERAPSSVLQEQVGVPTLQALAISGGVLATCATLTCLCGGSLLLALKVGAGVAVCSFCLLETHFILQHRRSVTEPLDQYWWELQATRPRPQEEHRPPIILNRRTASKNAAVEAADVPVTPELDELYRFICSTWSGGDLSRSACRDRGWTRKYWERYVNGGRERDRGILDTAGLIRKQGQSWVVDVSLEEALSISPALRLYAESKARTVGGRS